MKPRDPHTWPDAVTRILGHLQADGAARAVNKSEALVRDWADPARNQKPSLDQALALSVAYAAAGGEGAPFVEAFEHQIGARLDARDPCARALTTEVADAAREFGEALASALQCTIPGSSPLDAHRALADTREAEVAVARLIQRLSAILAARTGLAAGMGDGT